MKKKIISSFLALLSSFSLVNAKEHNIKTQKPKCATQTKNNTTNKDKYILGLLFLSCVVTPIMFKDKIINFCSQQKDEPKREPDIDRQQSEHMVKR